MPGRAPVAPPRPLPRREGFPGGPDEPAGPGRPVPPPRRGPRRPWWKRLKWGRVLGIVGIVMLLLGLGLWWYANSVFNRIEKVEVAEVLAHGGNGTNYFIVGSDSAEVLDKGDPAFDPDRPAGQRADTMMLLHFADGKAKIMSIPRDLWVTRADNGQKGKINGSYNGGPESLIETISNPDNLGIPIHRYMEVDFASFAGLVDGLGGITINFPHPASDKMTGLNITETGAVKLNGQQALAYVRSRHYTETIDGRQKPDPTGDLGRIQRQQQFLRAVFSKLGKSGNPITLLRTGSKVTGGLRIDNEMTMWGAFQFAMKLRGLEPTPVELPTKPFGNAIALREPESDAALDQFR